jgi:hypothetical protein
MQIVMLVETYVGGATDMEFHSYSLTGEGLGIAEDNVKGIKE